MRITHSEKYEDYIITNSPTGGIANEQTLYRFENGYGASVIYGRHSYGLEVAVIWFIPETEADWTITYNTPLTDDVIGRVEDLDEVLKQIKNLKGDR